MGATCSKNIPTEFDDGSISGKAIAMCLKGLSKCFTELEMNDDNSESFGFVLSKLDEVSSMLRILKPLHDKVDLRNE